MRRGDATIANNGLQIDQVFCDALKLNLERVLTKMTDRQAKSISRKLSVAPMMDWTDEVRFV
jgi:hypothetical protein